MGVAEGRQRRQRKKLTAADELICELVLNGIGGKTIAEAKRNLSIDEVVMWASYRKKRGPLNIGMRLESLFALSDYRRHVSRGGKQKFETFLRFHDEETQQEATLENVAAMFGAPVKVRARGVKRPDAPP